jgi:hypothetical protein
MKKYNKGILNTQLRILQPYAYPENMGMPFFNAEYDYVTTEIHYNNAFYRSNFREHLLLNANFREIFLIFLVTPNLHFR